MGRFDIDFRSLKPTYEEKIRPTTRDDFAAAGCSELLISKMFASEKSNNALLAPEEWFWKDRKWFKGWPQKVIDEIYEIAGGCFAEMPLEEQVAMLGIEIYTVSGSRAAGTRGLYESHDGTPVSIESYALECLLQDGRGLVTQNHVPVMFHYLVKYHFEKLYGHWMYWDEARRKWYTPSPDYTHKAMRAFEAAVSDPVGTFKENEEYFRIMGLRIEVLLEFIELVGRDHLEVEFRHRIEHNLPGYGGMADITFRADGLQFREVKGRDRMGGGQAWYVRNFARPLGLDYAIVRVVDMKPITV